MAQTRNIHYKFLKNNIYLTRELFTHQAIYKKLKELDEDKNPSFLVGNENTIDIDNMDKPKTYFSLYQSFQRFIKLIPPRLWK